MTHYDLIIIGTGSGNSVLDQRYDGLKVAIVEKGTFGGTCLNVGCIPTKMFVYSAEVAGTVRDSARFGVDASVNSVHWPEIRDRIFGRIDPIAEGGRKYRAEDSPNVTVYASQAHFTERKSLETADGRTLSADKIVIATGSHVSLPPVDGLTDDVIANPALPVHTSDTVMRLESLPGSMLVLGSGYIAAEMAHIFSALGTRVTLIARSGVLLSAQDGDISRRFTEDVTDRWDVRFNASTQSVRATPSGIELDYTDFDGECATVAADVLLVATGRRPSTDALRLDAAGYDTHIDGRVAVDQYQRVLTDGNPVDGVFALGDASSEYQLKHVANHEARVVAENLLAAEEGELISHDHRFVPSAVFSHPQIASVGLTEEQARHAGINYVTVVQDYGSVAYGWAMEDSRSFAKLIADKSTGQLIGAHIIGGSASMIIQPMIQAMAFGIPAKDLARGQYWIHPALPEVLENALLELQL
ncbi:mycothione reductase [Saxibacter everestensis]|uniref:Mycothione reductase n=1 Tax=Saxibacter everestensis TaxID=2909229 RepID=A0ABY8QYN7_9MICO|nr:mycothione reductase [Brevibacteriaceae bacterium ZFBP1038]